MPPENVPAKQRIGAFTAIAMIFTSFLLDALQFLLELIPVAGVILAWFLAAVGFIVFGFWFMLVGVDYLDRNGATKIIITLASCVAELTLLINMLPALTLGVISLILITRQEDGKPSRLFDVAASRKAAMSDEQKIAAQMRADARIQRDARSNASRMVRGSEPRTRQALAEEEA